MTLAGVLAGLVVVQAFGWWPEAPSSGDSTPADAPAIQVIDGDTFDHDGMRVRIAGIDAREVDDRCAYEAELAARATRRLRTLLAGGEIAMHRLPNGRDEDRYGRKLRIVTVDGREVGGALVAEGLAREWMGRRDPWCG